MDKRNQAVYTIWKARKGTRENKIVIDQRDRVLRAQSSATSAGEHGSAGTSLAMTYCLGPRPVKSTGYIPVVTAQDAYPRLRQNLLIDSYHFNTSIPRRLAGLPSGSVTPAVDKPWRSLVSPSRVNQRRV
jgi:hypothetical protein